MADLAALRELGEWMRSVGAVHARVGKLELTLAGSPIAPAATATSPAGPPIPPTEPVDAARRDLEDLLYSAGGDVGPFIRREAAE